MALRGSCSALYNNLSVLPRRPQALAYFAAVRGGTVHLVSAAADGLSASHRQLQAKEGGLPGSASVLTQVRAAPGPRPPPGAARPPALATPLSPPGRLVRAAGPRPARADLAEGHPGRGGEAEAGAAGARGPRGTSPAGACPADVRVGRLHHGLLARAGRRGPPPG